MTRMAEAPQQLKRSLFARQSLFVTFAVLFGLLAAPAFSRSNPSRSCNPLLELFEKLPEAEQKQLARKLVESCGNNAGTQRDCYLEETTKYIKDYQARLERNVRRQEAAKRFNELAPTEQEKVVRRLHDLCKGQSEDCYKDTLANILDETSPPSTTMRRPARLTSQRSPAEDTPPSSPPKPEPVLHHASIGQEDSLSQLRNFSPHGPIQYDAIPLRENHPPIVRLTPKSRNQYEVNFHPEQHQIFLDNREIYGARPEVLDTKESYVNGQKGRALWVTTTKGQRYVVPNPHQGDISIASIASGQPIGAGGEVEVVNGFIMKMNNRTSPFYPSSEKALLAETRRIVRDIQRSPIVRRETFIDSHGKRRTYVVTERYSVHVKTQETINEEQGGRVIEVMFDYELKEVSRKEVAN